MLSGPIRLVGRLLRGLIVVVVFGAAICVVVVQVQQRVFRHHVERLLADLDGVELHKSTWGDASRLTKSWGRWGHWDGECSAKSCKYDILVEDGSTRLAEHVLPDWAFAGLRKISSAYYSLGGRIGTVSLSLLVRDGFIVQSGLYARIEVPPDTGKEDEYGYGLFTAAVSLPRLSRSEEPIAFEHDPYYTAVRPGGCTNCMEAMLVYSDHTPAAEIRRLTRLNLSCFAGQMQCKTVEELLPASEPFHLYDWRTEGRPLPNEPVRPERPHACAVPAWVLGRDAAGVVLAEGVSSSRDVTTSDSYRTAYRVATVRVLRTLKGPLQPTDAPERVTTFVPTKWEPGVAETIEAGKRYFLMAFSRFEPRRDRVLTFGSARCSSVAAAAGVEEELMRGIGLDDELGDGELPHFPF